MKPKLLIINKEPFGSLTDSYMWCKYLRDKFDITFICFEGKETMEGVKIINVSNNGSKTIRGIRYILVCLWNIFFFNGPIIVVYFEHCDILKRIFPWKKMNLDIRTLAVWGDLKTRNHFNNKLKNTCELYDSVTLISNGIRQKLGLNNPNVYILPLGADCISYHKKDYKKMNLLYVGTLMDRKIDITIKGTYEFLKTHQKVELSYDIIGSGYPNQLNEYKLLVHKLNLDKYFHFHGKVPYHDLNIFFEHSNFGVSFVPITSYFNLQPVTKSFEYSNSGLFVIATATDENKRIINKHNGILINDNVEDFSSALEYIYIHNKEFCEVQIRNSLNQFTWEKIVNDQLCTILRKISQ